MPKLKTTFFCQHCGAQSSKWIGKCPSCNEWNTYVEEVLHKEGGEKKKGIGSSAQRATKPLLLSEIEQNGEIKITLPDKELNRVLGGGVVPGSVVLFGGEPGIGKSTLMLQVALQQKNSKTLYVSGEESEQQIRMRADRMTSSPTNSSQKADGGTPVPSSLGKEGDGTGCFIRRRVLAVDVR